MFKDCGKKVQRILAFFFATALVEFLNFFLRKRVERSNEELTALKFEVWFVFCFIYEAFAKSFFIVKKISEVLYYMITLSLISIQIF